MATDKITVTLETDTLTHARAAATAAGQSLSAWLDSAARERIRLDGARAVAALMAGPDGDEIRDDLTAAAADLDRMLDGIDQAA